MTSHDRKSSSTGRSARDRQDSEAQRAAHEGEPKAVDELVKMGSILMLMTMVDGQHTSRPVTCADATGNELWFLVDRTVDWVRAVAGGVATTHLTMSDPSDSRYLSLNGVTTVTTDRETLEDLWTPVARTWFTGMDDPRLAAIRFEAREGEYWEGPGTVVGRTFAMLRGVLTGNDASLGDHGAIAPDASS